MIEDTSLTSIPILIKGGEQDADEVANSIKTFFLRDYPGEELDEIINLEITQVGDEVTLDDAPFTEEADRRSVFDCSGTEDEILKGETAAFRRFLNAFQVWSVQANLRA